MGIEPSISAFGQLAATTAMAVPLAALVDAPWRLPLPGMEVWAALAGLALLSMAGATNTSLVTLLIPVSAVLLGTAFLGERLLPGQVGRMALIGCGLLAIDGRALRLGRRPGARAAAARADAHWCHRKLREAGKRAVRHRAPAINGVAAMSFRMLSWRAGCPALRGGRQPRRPGPDEPRDLDTGETAILLNYEHHPADTPHRARHTIFVREGADRAADLVGTVPDAIRIRPISLRVFDAAGNMVDADLADGIALGPLIGRFLSRPGVAYLHAHYAKRGCFAARIVRA